VAQAHLAVPRKLFASTAGGAVFQINYTDRSLECVYQLHSGAINCMRLNEGFCVTASADRYLRVWPLDFSDFFLEAQHETAVTAVDISADGLKVLRYSRVHVGF
jgi:WD40 repeat protein